MEDKRILTTLEEVKAVSDPYRYRILDCLYEMAEPATVKQIADRLGEVPAKIHYHIKKLEKLDIVRLDYTKEVNGIIAKFYKPTAKSFEIKCSKELDESAKKLMLGETQNMVSEIYNRSRETFLAQIDVPKKIMEESTGVGVISCDELYLSDEEVEEMKNYLQNFFEKYKSKRAEENIKRYHCFFTSIRIK